MLPRGGGAEAQDWHLDMQLTGQLVLSAAALLLLTAAYRLYKSRPARAPPRGTDTKAEAEGAAGCSQGTTVGPETPKGKQGGHRTARLQLGEHGGLQSPGHRRFIRSLRSWRG